MKTSRKQEMFMRSELPYGVRRYTNGASELFNRSYETIIRKGPLPTGEPIAQLFYFTDRNPPWRDAKTKLKCEKVLRDWYRP